MILNRPMPTLCWFIQLLLSNRYKFKEVILLMKYYMNTSYLCWGAFCVPYVYDSSVEYIQTSNVYSVYHSARALNCTTYSFVKDLEWVLFCFSLYFFFFCSSLLCLVFFFNLKSNQVSTMATDKYACYWSQSLISAYDK